MKKNSVEYDEAQIISNKRRLNFNFKNKLIKNSKIFIDAWPKDQGIIYNIINYKIATMPLFDIRIKDTEICIRIRHNEEEKKYKLYLLRHDIDCVGKHYNDEDGRIFPNNKICKCQNIKINIEEAFEISSDDIVVELSYYMDFFKEY